MLEKLPFFALAAAACVVTYAVQNQAGAVTAIDRFPLDARVGNALVSYCRYLGKFFWPADLAVYYPHPEYWPVEEVLLAGVFLSGIFVWFFVLRNRHPFLLMGWLWFLGTLVPVIGLVQVGGQAMADRYLYIPSIGLLVLIIWGAEEIWSATEGNEGKNARIGAFNGASSRLLLRGSLTMAELAALVACCVLTRQQLAYWRSSETLWKRAIAVTENNAFAITGLGNAYFDQGKVDAAIVQYQECARLRPGSVNNHVNLGAALLTRAGWTRPPASPKPACGLNPITKTPIITSAWSS